MEGGKQVSNTIDERILKMRFDNAQFESGIKDSMNSLTKFEKEINSSENISGFTAMAKTIDNVTTKVNALSVVGITTLARLTNAAISSGKKIASALTIDPLKSGFAEYQQQMDSTMVIMSNTGDTLETVTGALDELNVYADKTVYSFGQMTNAIGKFAAAGVNLKDSVAAIKGLSNAAALVGANGNQLFSAYYNLSQSMQMGYLQTIDYNSLANSTIFNKNMRDIMIETAIEMGKFTKDSEMATLATNNFKDSLQKKWLTSDIMLKALEKYSSTSTEIGKRATEAATELRSFKQLWDTVLESIGTGWADSWKLIFGDLNEAKKLWTDIGNVITGFAEKSSRSRNRILQDWKRFGGRNEFVNSIKNIMDSVQSIFKPISEGFKTIFPSKTGLQLAEITKKFADFTKGLILSKEEAKGLKNTVTLLLIPIKLITNAIGLLGKAAGYGLLKINELARSFLTMMSSTKNIENALSNLRKKAIDFLGEERYLRLSNALTKITGNFSRMISTIKSQIKGLKNQIGNSDSINGLFSALTNLKIKDGILNTIVWFFEKVAELTDGIDISKFNMFKLLGTILEGLASGALTVGNILGKLGNIAINVAGKILELATNANLLNLAFAGITAKGMYGIASGIAGIGLSIFGAGKTVKEFAENVEAVGKVIKGFAFKEYSEGIKEIAISIGILAVSMAVLSGIDSNNLWNVTMAITALGATLFAITAGIMVLADKLTFSKSIIGSFLESLKLKMILDKASSSMIKMSAAVLILSFSIEKFAKITENGYLLEGIVGVAGAIVTLCGGLALLGRVCPKLPSHSRSLLMLAASVGILALSVEKMSSLTFQQWAQGLVGIGAAITIISKAATMLASSAPSLSKGTTALIMMAAAVRILVPAIEQLGSMGIEEIVKGLGSVAGALLVFVEIAKMMTVSVGQVLAGSAAMILMGAAINAIVGPLQVLGQMPTNELITGLLSIGGALLEFTLVLKLMGSMAASVILGASAILIMSTSILMVAKAIKSLGALATDELIKGLVGLGVALVGLSAALIALGSLGPIVLAGAAAMLLGSVSVLTLAGAISVLTPALKTLVELDALDITMTLLALAGGFIALGAVTGILGLVSPLIAGTAISFGLLGGALVILSPALLALKGVGLGDIARELFSFGGASLVAGAGAAVMLLSAAGVTSFSFALLGLAGAITALGAAIENAKALADIFNAGRNLIGNFISGYKSEDVSQLGEYTADGISVGIQKKEGFLSKLGKGMANAIINGFCAKDAMDINSPSETMRKIAIWVSEGLFDGIKENQDSLKESMSDLGIDMSQSFIESAVEEGKQAGKISDVISSGIIKEAKDNEQFLLDSGISSANAFADGFEMALNARGKTMSSTAIEYVNSHSIDEISNWFEENKTNEDYFTDKVDSITQSVSAFDESEKSASKSTKELKDDIKDLAEEIQNGVNVFSEFEEVERDTFATLLTNIDSQIKGNREWLVSLTKLQDMGYNENIISKLTQMGVESRKEIAGLLEASEMQVRTYNLLFDEASNIGANATETLKLLLPTTAAMVAKNLDVTVDEVGYARKEIEDDVEDTTDTIVDGVEEIEDKVIPTMEDIVAQIPDITIGMNDISNSVVEMTEVSDEAIKITDELAKSEDDLTDSLTTTVEGFNFLKEAEKETIQPQYEFVEVTRNMAKELTIACGKMKVAMDEFKQSTKESIESSVDLFSRFDFTADLTKEDLILNMETQRNAVQYFGDGIAKLMERGLDDGLAQMLIDKGVDGGFKYIAAFLEMSKEELLHANDVYAQTMNLEESTAQQITDSFRKAGVWSVEGFMEGIEEDVGPLLEVMRNLGINSLYELCQVLGIASPSKETMKIGRFLDEGLILGVNEKRDQAKNTASVMAIGVKNAIDYILNRQNGYKIGENIISGIAEGIRDKAVSVANEAAEMARNAYEAACAAIGIESPSKAFAEIGMYADLGMAKGLSDYASAVANASSEVSQESLNVVRNSIDKISSMVTENMDSDPVIKPILDISEIQNGVSAIDGLLNKGAYSTRMLAQQASASIVNSRESEIANRTSDSNQSTTQSFNFTQNNYSPKALDRIEIYRQTKNQFSVMKGMV